MASSIIAYLNSILEDVELLVNETYKPGTKLKFKTLIFRLKNLKTFVLCAIKLSNQPSRESLVVRTKHIVGRNTSMIDALSLLSSSECPFGSDEEVENFVHSIEPNIQSLEEEINGWYKTLSAHSQQSNSLMTDEIEIIDSVLENIEDFLSFGSRFLGTHVLVKAMEASREQMGFMKNFIRFVALRGFEHHRPTENLLIHFAGVALDAAHLRRCDELDEEWWKGLQFRILLLLQKIKPDSPEIYRQHAPTLDMDHDPLIVIKDCLDSLISHLLEILQLDSFHVVCQKDQLRVLYEGLRFLKTSLQQPQNNFTEKIRDQIGSVLYDAGVSLCSVYQTRVELDFGLSDLLESIKFIRTEAGKEVSPTSVVNFPKTDGLGFLDFLLENLMEVSGGQAEPDVKFYAQTLQEELMFFRSSLGEIKELCNEQNEFQVFWNRTIEMAYKAEFLVEHLGVGDISHTFPVLFDSVNKDIQNLRIGALKVLQGKGHAIEVKSGSKKSSQVSSQTTPTITNDVVGFRDEAASIVDRLTRGSNQVRIIVITGMPGQGKTTLAAKVYSDPSVEYHFHIRAWCVVSQIMDKKKVLLELLKQIDPHRYPKMTEQGLTEKIWRHLKGKRYLIFLDDVWTIEAWNSLQGSFPNDSIGSRIIITSRLHNAAPHYMLDQDPLFLRQLSNLESWELLQRKLFLTEGCPPALIKLGKKIAENCKGLPLTIVIVAGLLAATKQEEWVNILDGFSSSFVSSTTQCINTLDLSYKHLPDFLKPCLLYFAIFPEEQEISVRRLVRLWIAEGFIRRAEFKSLEDAAETYMTELIGRSLVMVVQQRSTGGIKRCRVHELLHGFCLKRAKEEHFFHLLKGYDQLLALNEPSNLRRLCIHSEPNAHEGPTHFKKSKLIFPGARSLVFFSQKPWDRQTRLDISFVINIFKGLRVLDLEQIHLVSEFPSEIELLVQLRYLAIRGKSIPTSVGKLSKLETLILDPEINIVSIPDTLWHLGKLKFLYIRSVYYWSGGRLPTENLDSSFVLYDLDRLSGVILPSYGCMENQMKKFPNIRKLKCKIFEYWDNDENFDKILVPDFLTRLESLDIGYVGFQHGRMLEFGLPTNLKKLTLSDFWLPWEAMSSIGKLPNLEVLKLLKGSFTGEKWNMEEGEFSTLRFLAMSSLDIVSWTASDDQFTCFRKLVLFKCKKLKELPSCLEYISTLDMIEVLKCSDTTASLVKKIEEEQSNMGNSALKIMIR
ncbi:OLC1v1009908C1 [Oldenlandia corymbosa var. corymbosa]|uniref:OLC1v1009908C1 n=1 Tax=Oldenlandia corymbosa var. corymbosa TaxID=529605 RepID=A0AAV1DSN2_OLDCO|nr:OLC1v1009908C1 [Oldenlandia corymbosa var. corymbosa]